MIKPFKVLATSSLLLMLAACNTNDNAAFDALVPGDNNVTNMSYDRGDIAYTGKGGMRDFAYNTRINPRHNSSNDLAGSMDDSISADFTSLSSGNFPHTRAVQIRDAKFGYVVINPQQGNAQRITLPDLQSITEQYARRFQSQGGQWQQGQPKQQITMPGQAQQQRPTQQQIAKQPTQQAQPKPQAPAAKPSQPAKTTPTTQGISATEQQVINLTNAERRKAGLKDLIGDPKLSSVAKTKSNDMKAKGYFSHTSPTYGSPFDMMRDFGITYSTAGENIAQGQRTPEEVVRAWMNSEGHRKNILNGAFTHIGVGHETAGNHWTQMFIGK